MLFIVSFLVELLFMGVRRLWRLRVVGALAAGMLTAFASGMLLAGQPGVVPALILLLTVGRLLNQLRIIKDRMQPVHLRSAAARSAMIFGAAQLSLLLLLHSGIDVVYTAVVTPLSWLALIVESVLLIVTVSNIRKTRHFDQVEYYSDKELPTVSVLIPARNETRDLEDCLYSVLASDYPKLEIIVLDDCSHDETSEVIKSFAQDGVRFIQGTEPREEWLAKNQAYERLSQGASGELLLFCGVDVRLGPRSIRALVTTLLNRKKSMVSVMPRRLNSTVMAAFIQPMRYWWELALPRRIFNRPPVLSTCWLIRKESLEKLGGFAAVRRTILPEAYFARELVKTEDSYSFIRSDDVLDIQTVKNTSAQRETAIRIRYPQVRRRMENAMMLVLLEFVFLLGPFLLLAAHYLGLHLLHVLPLAVSCLLLIITHVLIVTVSNPANVPIALFSFPFVVISELALGIASMLKYEFSVVEWRGRNVCIPVMQVVPRLPES